MAKSLVPTQSGPPEQPDYGPVIDVARQAIDQQFVISERLDNKARGLVATGGAWFAVVQAVATGAFDIGGLDRTWKLLMVVAAGLGAGLLIATTALCARVWSTRTETDIAPQGLISMRNDIASGGDVVTDLIRHYAHILNTRAENNAQRAGHYKVAQRLWYGAMLFPLAELAVAFLAELLG